MAISYLDGLLNNLKTEMEDKMTPGDFYDSSPTVARGAVAWEDTDGKRPFIWFLSTNVEHEELMGDTAIVTLSIEAHGYADSNDYNGSDNMMTLLKDFQYFLYNDYTLPINISNCIISENSVVEDVGQSGFMLTFNIKAEIDTTTMQLMD